MGQQPRPEVLVVVGACGGMSRILTGDVLSLLPWREVWLLDTRSQVFTMDAPSFGDAEVKRGLVPQAGPITSLGWVTDEDGAPLAFPPMRAAVLIGVPGEALPAAAAYVAPHLLPGSVVFDLGSEKVKAIGAMTGVLGDIAVFGTHPLFGPQLNTIVGQTVVVCPSPIVPDAHRWFSDAVTEAAGIVKEMPSVRHDLVMAYVQTATHQSLLMFMDVIRSAPLDVYRDLWEARTPQFEALLALASRVLSPAQQRTIASIQVSTSGNQMLAEHEEAAARLGAVVTSGSVGAVVEYIGSILEPLSSTLFTRMQGASDLAIHAVQAPRSALARCLRSGELVGVVKKQGPSVLRVGQLREVSPTSLRLENLLVGPEGSAALLGPSYGANAKKLGFNGRAKEVEFALGKVDLFIGADLEAKLDRWLGSIRVDVRVLGPDSVSADAIAGSALGHPDIRTATARSTAILGGRREVVITCELRADKVIENLAAEVQRLLNETYAWPLGEVDAVLSEAPPTRVGFLGPEGTFSAIACDHLQKLTGAPDAERVPFVEFDTLLDALSNGEIDAAVLPICNSSTGLVDRAARILRHHGPGLIARGMVDVSVNFDAYARPGTVPGPGDVVRSQPQALRQCSEFINRLGLDPQATSSTAEAVAEVARGEADVAIAPRGLEQSHPVVVLEHDVGDRFGVITRFLVLTPAPDVESPAAGSDMIRWAWLLERRPVDLAPTARRYDEVIEGDDGVSLWISTDPDRFGSDDSARYLGSLPWIPQMPIDAA